MMFGSRILKNISANAARATVVGLVALILPSYLTHHLPVQVYAAWVLILQLGAYVSYLDLGIQTGVSKFVAQYDATGDHVEAGRHASAGFALMTLAGLLGLGLTSLLAWWVPKLFAAMPVTLYREARISLLLVGASLSFALVCAVYSAIFLGLQRYWIPTTITVVNRVSFTVCVLLVVAFHGNLIAMGLAVALVNVATGVMQILAWRTEAAHIRVSIHAVRYHVVREVARFCSLQSLWILAMLCITGLDIMIVGHYDYLQTAYYSIAALPTSLVVVVVSSMLGPLMPASSALSTRESSAVMGALLGKFTRYTTLLLLLTGLPLIVCGFPVLRVWVGPLYAAHSINYLRILVFANIVRNLGAPYATMVIATDKQEAATVVGICEAAVNLGSSIWLASRYGAIGVALGTAIGSFVSVLLHFAISMHYTRASLAISRSRLFLTGLLRPSITAIPSVLLLPFLLARDHAAVTPILGIIWGVSTVSLGWYTGLNINERKYLLNLFNKRTVLASCG
jgi:O-antigen/teichoic acid export membrane protein